MLSKVWTIDEEGLKVKGSLYPNCWIAHGPSMIFAQSTQNLTNHGGTWKNNVDLRIRMFPEYEGSSNESNDGSTSHP